MMVHAIGDDHLEKCLDKTRQQQTDDDGYDRGEHPMHCMTRISQQECRGILERYRTRVEVN